MISHALESYSYRKGPINRPSSNEKKPRDGFKRILPKIIPDKEHIPFDEQKREERIPPQVIPDNEEIPCNGRESDGRFSRQQMPGNDEIPCDDQKSDEQIQPHPSPEDDVIPSKDRKGAKRTHQFVKSPRLQQLRSRKPEIFAYSTRGTTKYQFLLVSWPARCTSSKVSSTLVQDRALSEKASSGQNG